MSLQNRCLTVILMAGTALTTNVPAFAQDSGLDEIIVTAERRAESIQDVPIAISAQTAETLQQSGINSTQDLKFVTPGLTIGTQLASAVPFIRGVGSQTTAVGQDAVVSTYVDDVYYSSSLGSILTLANIDRVEVLKGPQGTLFGRNATGGLMHIVTKDPTQEFSGNLEVGYGNFNTIDGRAYLTGGLGENVAADLSVYFSEQGDGYGVNTVTGNDVNETDEFIIRSKVLINAGDSTEIKLSADYAKTDTSSGVSMRLAEGALGIDGAFVFGACLGGGIPGVPADPAACAPVAAGAATQFTGDYQDIQSSLDPFAEIEQWGVSAIINHSFGDVDLTSVTAFRNTEGTQAAAQAAINLPGFLDFTLSQETDTFTQEFRLSSSAGNLDWILGAFFLDETAGYMPPTLSGAAFSPLDGLNDDNQQDTFSWALFGQGDYNIGENTTLTGGLRYTSDDRELTGTTTGTVGGVVAASLDYQDDEQWEELTWRLALSHQFSDDTMAYASYNRGFKSGVYNLNVLDPVNGPTDPVEPELLDAYEIGLKTEFADNRVRLNAAAYLYDYQDLQFTISRAGATFIANAAEATLKGAEVELLAAVTDSLTINAGLAYLDTEFDSFPDGVDNQPTGFGGNVEVIRDLSGNENARSPEFTFSAGFAYEKDIGFGKVITSANYFYSDDFYWEPSNRQEQDSYSVVNAQMTWEHPNNGVYLRGFINNIADTEYSNFSLTSALGDFETAAPPRTYGIKAGVNF